MNFDNWTRRKKIKLLIALFVLVIMQMFFAASVYAQTFDEQVIIDDCDNPRFDFNASNQFNQMLWNCSQQIETGGPVVISGLKVSLSRNTFSGPIYAKVYDNEGSGVSFSQCVGTNVNTLGIGNVEDTQTVIFDDPVTLPALGNTTSAGISFQVNDQCTDFIGSSRLAGFGAGSNNSSAYAEIIFSSEVDQDQTYSDDLNFQTRFVDGFATGTASTSIAFSIDYFLETSEYNATNRPDFIQATVLANGFLNDTQVALQKKIILPLSDGPATKLIPVTHNFIDGNYLAYINFGNITTDSETFTKTLLVLDFEISGGAVVSSTIEVFDNTVFNPDTEYSDCSIRDLSACFTNALTYVFVPDSNTFTRFAGLYTAIENKPPFGYVTKIKNALAGVGASTTPAFDFGNIPFIATIFEPLKLLMITGLWIIYALFLMGRLDKLDI